MLMKYCVDDAFTNPGADSGFGHFWTLIRTAIAGIQFRSAWSGNKRIALGVRLSVRDHKGKRLVWQRKT